MDSKSKSLTATAMRARINRNYVTLIKQFEDLFEELSNERDLPPFSSGANAASKAIGANDIAQRALRIQGISMHMTRAAEDFLSLSRQMQELWLFGKLDAAEDGGKDIESMQEDAKRIAELLEEIGREKAAADSSS